MDRASAAAVNAGTSDAFAPIVFNRPGRRLTAPFKVVAFNALGCGDPEAVADCLRRPPLAGATAILLSEVDWGLRRSHIRHCAEELATLLSMSFAYAPEFGFTRDDPEFRSFFGNAILSAVPLENVRIVPLPTHYDWTNKRLRGTASGTRRVGQRGGVTAEVTLAGRNVSLALAHLENRVGPEVRALQMAQFLNALPADGPTVIGGDFNTTTANFWSRRECAALLARILLDPRRLRRPEPYEPLFGVLERAGFEYRNANSPLRPTFTPSGLIPRFMRPKLDWIALRRLTAVPGSARVISARHRMKRLSDHDFIVCDFTV
jgi:endonuclease/exonuclease/phosphatase family metal-dependent hydrolase